MKALSENELENVSGGTLSQEASEWVGRNESIVRSRARQSGISDWMVDYALSYVTNGSTYYDVPALKNAIANFGVNVSDLN